MSLAEILEQIPKLSFAERQELIRRTIEVDDNGLTSGEEEILSKRLEDFDPKATSGLSLDELQQSVQKKLSAR